MSKLKKTFHINKGSNLGIIFNYNNHINANILFNFSRFTK